MKDAPSPCYKCTHRSTYCRIKCDDWNMWKKEHEEKRNKEIKKRRAETLLCSYQSDLNDTLKKRSKWHKKGKH